MGQPPRCTRTPPNSKPDLFDQAEQAAFQHVNANLNEMRFCSEADLCQAAKSYFFQSARASGAASLFSEEYVRVKAARLGAWWNQKHTANRTRRPHTKYSAAQAARGRHVAAIRKRSRADWTGLQVQLMRRQGGKLAAIAGELGCTIRTISNLSKRLFPKIVGVVLSHYFGWKHRSSSAVRTPHKQDVSKGEKLPRFQLAGRPAVKQPAVQWIDGEIDDLEAIGLAIPDLLRSHWAAQPL